MQTSSFHGPARDTLLEGRKSVVGGWLEIADALDVQGEVVLGGDVRQFANALRMKDGSICLIGSSE